MEYAYSEQVKVVDGVCDVVHQSTRDYLLKVGYEETIDSELVGVGVTAGQPEKDSVETSPRRASSRKHGKKKRR